MVGTIGKDHNSLRAWFVTMWKSENGSYMSVTILACRGDIWAAIEVPGVILRAYESMYHTEHTRKAYKKQGTNSMISNL